MSSISTKVTLCSGSRWRPDIFIRRRIAHRLSALAPVLLPLFILIVTGVRGLDFGVHWDEKGYQIAPVETMVKTGILLPQYYGYPSFNYWVNLAGLIPDLVAAWPEKGNVRQKALEATEQALRAAGGYRYHMRLRTIFLVLTALSVVWVYLLVLSWRQSWVEALLAASFLAFSWEVAYHIRWVATDGMSMQFAALTLLSVVLSCIRRDARKWLRFAAIAAGLGFGTKYPGGLLLVPVLVAGYLSSRNANLPRYRVMTSLVELVVIFTGVYLLTTPATVLHPAKFVAGVLYEMMGHYSLGHAGHTVSPGLEHGARMLAYVSMVLFSPYAPIAMLFFALSIIGSYALVKEAPQTAILFFCFPVLYLLYFSIQRAMVVRNILVIAPFMAILAARGANSLWRQLQLNYSTRSIAGAQYSLPQYSLAILIVAPLLINGGWLVYAAETIRDRRTDRFIHEAASYILAEKHKRFFLSPLMTTKLTSEGITGLPNLTSDWTAANEVILYASEGMKRWQDWPANRPTLTKTWFGPYEVNFNIYPNWWGDDRIIVMDLKQAREVGLLILSTGETDNSRSSENSADQADTAFPQPYPVEINGSKVSWDLPHVDPCTLVTRGEAEAGIGELRTDPAPGGYALDGTSCAYVGASSVVIRITLISTAAFELQKYNPGNTVITGLGNDAYVTATNFDDVHLFLREPKMALMVSVFPVPGDNLAIQSKPIARYVAEKALGRLMGTGYERATD